MNDQKWVDTVGFIFPLEEHKKVKYDNGELYIEENGSTRLLMNATFCIQSKTVRRSQNRDDIWGINGTLYIKNVTPISFNVPFNAIPGIFDYFFKWGAQYGEYIYSDLPTPRARQLIGLLCSKIIYYMEAHQLLSTHFIFSSIGFYDHMGKLLYAQDGATPQLPNGHFETGYAFQYNETLDMHMLFMSLTHMSTNIEANASIVLFKLLGLLQTFFSIIEFQPTRFMLLLCGPSNAGKTYIAKAMYSNHIGDDSQKIPATFKDSKVGLELAIKNSHPVCLFDDFTVGSDTRKLDDLARYYGDGIGRNVSNTNREIVRGVPPTTLGAVCMEFIPQGLAWSALTRMIVVDVSPNDFPKNLGASGVSGLAAGLLQRPDIVGTFDTTFTGYICNNSDKVARILFDAYNQAREIPKASSITERFKVAYAHFMSALMVLLEFGKDYCGVTENEARDLYIQYSEALWSLIIKNDSRKYQLDIVSGYLSAMLQVINGGIVSLGENKRSFTGRFNELDGFWCEDGSYVEVKADILHRAILDYLSQMVGVAPMVEQGTINRQIWEIHPTIIKKFSDRYNHRINVSEERRMTVTTMVINHKELQRIVEEAINMN